MSGLVAGGVLFFSVTAAIGIDAIPVASLIAALLITFAALSAAALGGRLGAGIAGGLGAAAPIIALGCLSWISTPIVTSHWQCGTGLVGLYLIGAGVFVSAPAVGAVVMALGAGRWPRVAGAVVTAGGVALLIFLVPRGLTRLDAPTPDAWVETLPIVGTLPAVAAGEGPTWCGEETEYRPGATCAPGYECLAARCQRQDEVALPGITLHRSCTATGHCLVSLVPVESRTPLRPAAAGAEAAAGFGEPLELFSSQALPARYDAAHDLWVVGTEHNRVAFEGRSGEAVDVDAWRIADSIAPPRGWVIAGVGGLGSVALGWLLAAIAWGRARRIRRARSGQVDSYGGIAFTDGLRPYRGLPAAPTAEGPVMATPRGRYHPPGYRTVEGPVIWDAIPGDREAITDRYEARVDAWLNVALSAAWLTAAPLAAAAFAGLLG